MQTLENVFSIIKVYCQNAPSKGFVSFASISSEAGVTRAELKEYLEKLKKMKMITYSSVGNCYLLVTKLGMSTKSLAA
jgi:Mn-dependent DtxR family transcriptional regulator